MNQVSEEYPIIDVVLHRHAALEGSDEFVLGLRDLRRRLSGVRRWYSAADGALPAPSAFPAWSDAQFVLVIINPAVVVSDNILPELLAGLRTDEGATCVLPSDPRGFTAGVSIDYASRSSFDRFVARLAGGERWLAYDGREPWLYLVHRQVLQEQGDAAWETLPSLSVVHTVVAGHAFVHSYGDYYANNRAEMLSLLPSEVRTLLDVGGGEGNFSRAFMAERGGQATLLEPNAKMEQTAHEHGVKVIKGDFQSVALIEQYDCVAFLDVLEHMVDPLSALIKARQALKPGGFLLLSVPNIGHWSVVWDLLEGRFDYLPVGILCSTHVRFFTRAGVHLLLEDAGFRVECCKGIQSPPPVAFTEFVLNRSVAEVAPDMESLSTESFHIRARFDV